MSDQEEWAFPPEFQPDAEATRFDLERALSAVVALEADVPADAFTARSSGTERTGQRGRHPRGRPRADDRLPGDRGDQRQADDARRPHRGRAPDRRSTSRPASASCSRSASSASRRCRAAALASLSPGDTVNGDLARRAQPRARRAHRREARVRRLLGIPARRGAVHRAAAPGVERRRAGRHARAARRHRLAVRAAGDRRRHDARQHVRAGRDRRAGAAGPAAPGPPRRGAAPVARRLPRRRGRPRRRAGRRAGRPGRERGPASPATRSPRSPTSRSCRSRTRGACCGGRAPRA